MKRIYDLLRNHRIRIILGILLMIPIVSCVGTVDRCEAWKKITMEDMVAACLYRDDSTTLKVLINNGLPINNYFGHYGNCEKILCFKDAIHRFRMRQRTLFLEALHQNAINCATLLLDNGADASKIDEDGTNALMLMTCLSEKHVVKMANRISSEYSFDINASNSYNSTALGAAIRANNGEYVRWLIDNGADYAQMNGDCKRTVKKPVVFDAVNSRKDIFDLILNKPNAPITSLDCRGNGILSWLRPKTDDYETRFRFLLDKGAKITNADRNHNILIFNMTWLKDCRDRVSMICPYITDQEILKDAILYARKKNYSNCVEVIEDCLNAWDTKEE